MAALCEEAFRTRVVNSDGVRSAIERRCRGAKGDVEGVEGVELEYARLEDLEICCKTALAGRICAVDGILRYFPEPIESIALQLKRADSEA